MTKEFAEACQKYFDWVNGNGGSCSEVMCYCEEHNVDYDEVMDFEDEHEEEYLLGHAWQEMN